MLQSKSIFMIGALIGIVAIGTLVIIILNEENNISIKEQIPSTVENSLCNISSTEYLYTKNLQNGSTLELSLFVKPNSTSTLCFAYYFPYGDKEKLELTPEIYQSEQGNMNLYNGKEIIISSNPDSISPDKDSVIVAYQIKTSNNLQDKVYFLSIPASCGLFPIVIVNDKSSSFPELEMIGGEKHCGNISWDIKLIGTHGGLLDYAKVKYVYP